MELSINPNTIQRAYAQLEQEGFVYPVKGRGNFVSPDLEAAARKRKMFFRELEGLLGKGRSYGVTREELQGFVDRYYEEGAI